MGYILPVGQFQYKDYQKRAEETKQDRFFVEKTGKVQMETKYLQLDQDQPFKGKHDPSKAGLARETGKAYAQLTGTGARFNKKV
jgi:hypothetical protein